MVQAIATQRLRGRRLFRICLAVATLLFLGGILIPATRVFGEHTVFALEAYEIGFAAVLGGSNRTSEPSRSRGAGESVPRGNRGISAGNVVGASSYYDPRRMARRGYGQRLRKV